jgi:hypothetical protein
MLRRMLRSMPGAGSAATRTGGNQTHGERGSAGNRNRDSEGPAGIRPAKNEAETQGMLSVNAPWSNAWPRPRAAAASSRAGRVAELCRTTSAWLGRTGGTGVPVQWRPP